MEYVLSSWNVVYSTNNSPTKANHTQGCKPLSWFPSSKKPLSDPRLPWTRWQDALLLISLQKASGSTRWILASSSPQTCFTVQEWLQSLVWNTWSRVKRFILSAVPEGRMKLQRPSHSWPLRMRPSSAAKPWPSTEAAASPASTKISKKTCLSACTNCNVDNGW